MMLRLNSAKYYMFNVLGIHHFTLYTVSKFNACYFAYIIGLYVHLLQI
jgi:hypothetical protein